MNIYVGNEIFDYDVRFLGFVAIKSHQELLKYANTDFMEKFGGTFENLSVRNLFGCFKKKRHQIKSRMLMKSLIGKYDSNAFTKYVDKLQQN